MKLKFNEIISNILILVLCLISEYINTNFKSFKCNFNCSPRKSNKILQILDDDFEWNFRISNAFLVSSKKFNRY